MEQENPDPMETGSTVAMLQAEIQKTIEFYCGEPTLRAAMLRAVARPGFALHSEAPCRAGFLTLEIYRVISGPPSVAAIQAAVAVELHMQTAYLFDSVADRDKGTGDDLNAAEELALAIGLLTCGQSAVVEAILAAGRQGSSLRSLMQWVRDCGSNCCTGQFLDARLEKQCSATAEESLKMTTLKAGSLGRFATGLGARMATEDPEIVNLSGQFGFNLFTYFQLVDDLRDACPAQSAQTDLKQHKKTLPVVFFHNSRTERNPRVVCSIILSEACDVTKVDARLEFEASGARAFGAIAAEAFLNRAKSNLADIKHRLGTVGSLERFVRSFEITPQDVLVTS
jgi:geranylgeranyl pyrophosphate synthase